MREFLNQNLWILGILAAVVISMQLWVGRRVIKDANKQRRERQRRLNQPLPSACKVAVVSFTRITTNLYEAVLDFGQEEKVVRVRAAEGERVTLPGSIVTVYPHYDKDGYIQWIFPFVPPPHLQQQCS